jgi:ABC-type transport system involved in multi-copper enzyme maturation permease subunit
MNVLQRIWAIGLNTFREAIRNRILYGILFLVFVSNIVGLVMAQMSLHEEARVARDTAVAGVSFFGSITAVYLGVSMLYAEIQKKTIHTILSKPMERWEFVVGKYAGMAVTLLILTGLFAVALAAQLSVQSVPFDGRILRAVILAFGEVAVVAAIAVFFSSFSTPFLSGIFTVGIWILGRWSNEIYFSAQKAKVEGLRYIAKAAIALVPDMTLFAVTGSELDGKHVSVNSDYVGWTYVFSSMSFALLWVVGLLVLATLIFRRRDFV